MSKITLNGKTVEGMPKTVKLPVNGKELELTLSYISATEKPIKWEWYPVSGNSKLLAKSEKSGNRISTSLEIDKKVIFTNLTAQSVFSVINAKFSQPVSTTDSIYKKCNPARKEGKNGSGSSSMTIIDNGEW